MTWFVIIAAAMTALALAWVLPPLLRARGTGAGVERSASNLALLRDQLAELDADLRSGAIAPGQHESARAELERRVLAEGAGEAPAGSPRGSGRLTAVVVGASLPVLAALFYLQTGTPGALAPENVHGDASTPQQVEQIVARLAARLEANPDDPTGWALLGRSYYALGRYAEAVQAYARAVRLVSDDAGLYADYADALAMSRGQRLDDEVLVLVNQALKINPDHLKALALAGSAALERKDYRGAVGYLERLQRQLPADTQLAGMVTQRLEEARERAGEAGGRAGEPRERAGGPPAAQAATPASAGGPTVKGRVSLSPALAAKAAATDTVFILARAAEGPRMPLAILKRQVKDLPVEFTLSDEQAMAPQMKISKFNEVVIVARVSKSGGAAPQSGDLQGATGAVKVGATGVELVIDSVVP